MTHCKIRPIFTFKFSIFVFCQKLKEDLFNDFVLCFNNFPKRLRPKQIEIFIFPTIKNVHFAWLTTQILHKNQIPI